MTHRELFGVDEIGERKPIPKGGYAARPGTGPAGETCRTCRHLRRATWHGLTYFKCGLVEPSNAESTDIAIGTAACWGWEAAST